MKKFYTKHFEIYWEGKWIRPFRLKDVFVYREPTEATITEITYTHLQTSIMKWTVCGFGALRKKHLLSEKNPMYL